MRGSLRELRSRGPHFSDPQTAIESALTPKNHPPIVRPACRPRGWCNTRPTRSRRWHGSRPPTSRGLLRHVRPIAPGNGPGSPPPWYLGRSGGLFFAASASGGATLVSNRLPCGHGEACFSPRCRADHPLDHGRHRGLGPVSRDRRLASQPRPTADARGARLRGRVPGILADDARGVAPGEIVAATPQRRRGSARRQQRRRLSRGHRACRRTTA